MLIGGRYEKTASDLTPSTVLTTRWNRCCSRDQSKRQAERLSRRDTSRTSSWAFALISANLLERIAMRMVMSRTLLNALRTISNEPVLCM